MDVRKDFVFGGFISRQQALLMHKILQYSKVYPKGPSIKELEEALRDHKEGADEDIKGLENAEEIGSMIRSINNIYKKELKIGPVIIGKTSPTEPSLGKRYNLNPEYVVTRYLTAKMLMQLFRFRQHPGEINRRKIVDYIQEQFWFKDSIYGADEGDTDEDKLAEIYTKTFIKEKIDWCLSEKVNYLYYNDEKPGYIGVTDRIRFEIQYIALLCAFVPDSPKVQPSPNQQATEKEIEKTRPDVSLNELQLIKPEQEPSDRPFPGLDEFQTGIRKFHKELSRIDNKIDLYRIYHLWQIFGDAIQRQIIRKVFRGKDAKRVGIHVATRRSKQADDLDAVRNYIEFRATGGTSELRHMVGKKDLEKMEEGFAEELKTAEKLLFGEEDTFQF